MSIPLEPGLIYHIGREKEPAEIEEHIVGQPETPITPIKQYPLIKALKRLLNI